MHLKLLAAAVFALLFFVPSNSVAACCDQAHACCQKAEAPCCTHKDHGKTSLLELMPIDTDLAPTPGAVQAFEVWFKHPTWIGRSIVQGRYVIEHDNDRMARGEPCTHVYAFDDREKPVATFHCTHLERERSTRNTVVLVTTSDGLKKLTEFQFAGESASHGYPNIR